MGPSADNFSLITLYHEPVTNTVISAPPDCESGKFSCGDYKFNKTYCIAPHWRCDKVYDCHDKSDEQNCSKYHETDIHCSHVNTAKPNISSFNLVSIE